MTSPRRIWTRDAVEALGPTTDVPTAASVLNIGDWTVYNLIRRGEWTVTRVLRLGRKIRIPTQDLLNLLYGPPDANEATDPAASHGA
jgi:excisionase family DNA binding protein